jgi:hypothetical protein
MNGFILTALAFPVAPADLIGFVLDRFSWVNITPAPPVVTTGRAFEIPASDRSILSIPALDRSILSIPGTDHSILSIPASAKD